MLKENQKVEVLWNGRTKKWYEDKGYEFTKLQDKFWVDVNDLPHSSGQRVTVICDYCGKEYTTRYCCYQKGIEANQKNACSHCACAKRHDITFEEDRNIHFDKLKNILSENGYSLITTIDEYTSVKMTVKYICPKHGEQTGLLDNIVHGHFCNACGNEASSLKQSLLPDQVETYINSVNGNTLLNKDEYINARVINLKILCRCGNIFVTSYNNYACGSKNKNRCDICTKNISAGEYRISNFLDENYINYIAEYRFMDCRDIKPLPFDFYLPEYNCCIEFDGEQHFRAAFGQEAFESTQIHDKIKNEYCSNNCIKLIRIPYTEINNIESILCKELKLDIEERHYSKIKIRFPNNLYKI